MINMEDYVRYCKRTFQRGKKVVLDSDMKDDSPNAPKKGESGIIQCVDDMGTVHVLWESGSRLGLIPEEDNFHLEVV